MMRVVAAGVIAGIVAMMVRLGLEWRGVPALGTVATPLLVHVLAGIVAAALLGWRRESLGTYARRAGAVVLLVMFAAIATYGVDWATGALSLGAAAAAGVTLIASWVVAGLVLGWMARPRPSRETVELRGAPIGRERPLER